MSTFGKLAVLVVGGPIAVVVLGIGGCEATKVYYDWRVGQMCERDGGVTVYERVAIGRDLLAKMKGDINGVPVVPSESAYVLDVPVFLRQVDQRVREAEPRIGRTEFQIVRRSDGKIMAKSIFYSRSGGDFPFTGSHSSYFSCPSSSELERKTFVVEGAAE
jgi:hypothetical protein